MEPSDLFALETRLRNYVSQLVSPIQSNTQQLSEEFGKVLDQVSSQKLELEENTQGVRMMKLRLRAVEAIEPRMVEFNNDQAMADLKLTQRVDTLEAAVDNVSHRYSYFDSRFSGIEKALEQLNASEAARVQQISNLNESVTRQLLSTRDHVNSQVSELRLVSTQCREYLEDTKTKFTGPCLASLEKMENRVQFLQLAVNRQVSDMRELYDKLEDDIQYLSNRSLQCIEQIRSLTDTRGQTQASLEETQQTLPWFVHDLLSQFLYQTLETRQLNQLLSVEDKVLGEGFRIKSMIELQSQIYDRRRVYLHRAQQYSSQRTDKKNAARQSLKINESVLSGASIPEHEKTSTLVLPTPSKLKQRPSLRRWQPPSRKASHVIEAEPGSPDTSSQLLPTSLVSRPVTPTSYIEPVLQYEKEQPLNRVVQPKLSLPESSISEQSSVHALQPVMDSHPEAIFAVTSQEIEEDQEEGDEMPIENHYVEFSDLVELESSIDELRSVLYTVETNLANIYSELSDKIEQNQNSLQQELLGQIHALTIKFSLLEEEVKSFYKTTKTNKEKALAQTVSELSAGLDSLSKEVGSLQHSATPQLLDSCMECFRILHLLISKDEEDRESVHLTATADKRLKFKSSSRIKSPGVSLKPDCVSCSGNRNSLLGLFKSACLNYSPSPIEYNSRVYTRVEMLNKLRALIRLGPVQTPYTVCTTPELVTYGSVERWRTRLPRSQQPSPSLKKPICKY